MIWTEKRQAVFNILQNKMMLLNILLPSPKWLQRIVCISSGQYFSEFVGCLNGVITTQTQLQVNSLQFTVLLFYKAAERLEQ